MKQGTTHSIKVFFRYDDFSAVSDEVVDRGLVEIFGRHNLSCTFAVIPRVTEGNYRDPAPRGCLELPEAKKTLLQQAAKSGVVDVALHGLIHRSNGLGTSHSEFRGLDRSTQSRKIRDGKELLDTITGAPVIAFVPPWNTYDDRTIEALHENDLECLSANRFGPMTRVAPGMRFVPITAELGDLERAIDQARQSGDPAPVVGILMHPYDFRESGDARAQTTLEELGRKLQWLVSQPDVIPTNVSKLAREVDNLDMQRYAANRPLRFEQAAPPGVALVADTPYYSSTSPARQSRRKRLLATLAVHGLAALAGLGGGFVLGGISQRLESWSVIPLAIFLVIPLGLLLWRAHRQAGLFFRSMFIVSGLGGTLVGMLAAWISHA